MQLTYYKVNKIRSLRIHLLFIGSFFYGFKLNPPSLVHFFVSKFVH